MATILIKNAKLVRDNVKEADVFVRDGVITKIGRVDRNADIVIDGTDKYLLKRVFLKFEDPRLDVGTLFWA